MSNQYKRYRRSKKYIDKESLKRLRKGALTLKYIELYNIPEEPAPYWGFENKSAERGIVIMPEKPYVGGIPIKPIHKTDDKPALIMLNGKVIGKLSQTIRVNMSSQFGIVDPHHIINTTKWK